MQDPMLARVKLIAEPWDLGPGGYQLGNHPAGMAEWNDKFRDDVRRFWRGDSRAARRAGGAAAGIGGPVRSSRAPALGIAQLHHRARWLHAAGLGQLRPASTTRPTARTIATAPTTTQQQLGRRGSDRRRGDPRDARARQARDAGDAAVLARHADAAGRRRIRPHPAAATTTPTARTTRSPGSTGRRRMSRRGSRAAACTWRGCIQLRREYCTLRSGYYQHGRLEPVPQVRDIEWFDENGDVMRAEDWQYTEGRLLCRAPRGAPGRRAGRDQPAADQQHRRGAHAFSCRIRRFRWWLRLEQRRRARRRPRRSNVPRSRSRRTVCSC